MKVWFLGIELEILLVMSEGDDGDCDGDDGVSDDNDVVRLTIIAMVMSRR